MADGKVAEIQLENYDVSEKTGFLVESALEKLPEYFEPWNRLAKIMPDLVNKKTLREEVLRMPQLDDSKLMTNKERKLAHLQLSVIGAGYVWQEGDNGVVKSIPRCLSVPWYKVSQTLGFQAIIAHPSICLANWKPIHPERPLCLENMRSLYELPGGEGFDWFCVVTCAVELEFARCLKPILSILQGVEDDNIDAVILGLVAVTKTVRNMKAILARMHDKLSGDLFYNVIRPYLSGWGGESNPLPEGLIYEGVEDDKPIQVTGGSAAQSMTLQMLDVVLGIQHSRDKKDFLEKMRKYILPTHRKLILDIEGLPKNVRSMVSTSDDEELKKEYNTCVEAVSDFRTYHIQIVTKYVIISANKHNRNKEFESLAKQGTGGTSLIPFLKDLRTDTDDALL